MKTDRLFTDAPPDIDKLLTDAFREAMWGITEATAIRMGIPSATLSKKINPGDNFSMLNNMFRLIDTADQVSLEKTGRRCMDGVRLYIASNISKPNQEHNCNGNINDEFLKIVNACGELAGILNDCKGGAVDGFNKAEREMILRLTAVIEQQCTNIGRELNNGK